MADLTTLEAVKDYLGMKAGETAIDGQIGRLISAESQRFIDLSGNPILQASYTDTRDGNGTRYILPLAAWRRYPLQSVTSVTVDGVAIPARASLEDDGYSVVDGRIELVGFIFTSTKATIYHGTLAFPGFGGLSAGTSNVVIQYTAGYAAVPADVDQAVVEMVALKLKGSGRVGLQTMSIQGESISVASNPWAEISSVIDAYTRPVI